MLHPLPFAEQLRLLLEQGLSDNTVLTLSEISEATGLSDQTLANLLQGKSINPRLTTLRALCQYFDISLDYFACTSEKACLAYLFVHRHRKHSPELTEIEAITERISTRGQNNVLSLMELMQRVCDIFKI